MFELAIKDDFAAAHFLRGYEGPCEKLHGHTWKVEVVVEGKDLNALGLVVDFKEIKKQLKQFLKQLDHVNLNDAVYFQKVNPTTENLAKYIFVEFGKEIAPLCLKHVTVWESEVTSVTYYCD